MRTVISSTLGIFLLLLGIYLIGILTGIKNIPNTPNHITGMNSEDSLLLASIKSTAFDMPNPSDADNCFTDNNEIYKKYDYKDNFYNVAEHIYNYSSMICNFNKATLDSYILTSKKQHNLFLKFLKNKNNETTEAIVKSMSESLLRYDISLIPSLLYHFVTGITTLADEKLVTKEMAVNETFFKPFYFDAFGAKLPLSYILSPPMQINDGLDYLKNLTNVIKGRLLEHKDSFVIIPKFIVHFLWLNPNYNSTVEALNNLVDGDIKSVPETRIANITNIDHLKIVFHGFIIDSLEGCELRLKNEVSHCDYSNRCRTREKLRGAPVNPYSYDGNIILVVFGVDDKDNNELATITSGENLIAKEQKTTAIYNKTPITNTKMISEITNTYQADTFITTSEQVEAALTTKNDETHDITHFTEHPKSVITNKMYEKELKEIPINVTYDIITNLETPKEKTKNHNVMINQKKSHISEKNNY